MATLITGFKYYVVDHVTNSVRKRLGDRVGLKKNFYLYSKACLIENHNSGTVFVDVLQQQSR